jgi:tungstate transport system substrate-binding protein
VLLRLPILVAIAASAAVLAGCGSSSSSSNGSSGGTGSGSKTIFLATTTSVQDSGLLDQLLPEFQSQSGYTVKTVAVGSGDALAMADRGEADVVIAHDPKTEKELVSTGKATQSVLMHNDFVVIGPASDPAGVKQATSGADALKRIAEKQAPFISRGDESGTNKFELKQWDAAGITPSGSWYQESGQGMGQTITIASQKQAYTISDRATYLATKDASGLAILYQGTPDMLNVYDVLPVTAKAGSRVNVSGGEAFATFMLSPAVQDEIGQFGKDKYGVALFDPDAGQTMQQIEQELANTG